MRAHKYAIHSAYLGDSRPLAWSNLGHWAQAQNPCNAMRYVDACAQLADRLALALRLNANDVLFDLGCGQGASLLHWQQHYAVKRIYAVELQTACIETIQQHLKPYPQLYCASFYALHALDFAEKADVVICLDAAYHGKLTDFLRAVASVMQPKARLGFHSLIWTARAASMTWQQRQYYRLLLKAADVDVANLFDAYNFEMQLQHQQFQQVEITVLSTEVLKGFADYIQLQRAPMRDHSGQGSMLDRFKIQMTAKLCQRLYQDGFVDYVQVTAQYAGSILEMHSKNNMFKCY